MYIKQNASGCADDLRRVGCFWRTGIHIAEELSGMKVPSVGELNYLWDRSLTEGDMIDEGYGPELQHGVIPVVYRGLKYFGCEKKVAEVGIFRSGKVSYYGWYKDLTEPYNGATFYVQKVRLGDDHVEPFHYRLVDYKGEIVFDPYAPRLEECGIEYSIIVKEIT